ncbi:MAG: OmpA family protein [Candidatus Poribacteria bacterium]|nr:OmpA family protein [Candidatus Poribacteria bacterium]
MEDNTLDFNFWPSFSDLMLTLVLILVIVVFAVIAAFSIGTDDLRKELTNTKGELAKVKTEQKEIAEALAKVEEKQKTLIRAIAAAYDVQWEDIDKWEDKESKTNFFEIPIYLENGEYTEIQIQNEQKLQRYSFSDRILFRRNKYDLNEEGMRTLRFVGSKIEENLKDITEIQIQGHADPDRPANEPFFNLDLAASRAIEVYKFLKRSIRIDPASHLMSATSFGEYKPVQRSTDDSTYNRQKLMQDNSTRALKAKNRRIEILLFYRLEQGD